MTYFDDELDNDLKEKLDLLQPTPPRDPVKAMHMREDYMKEVKYLQFGKPVFAIAGLLNRKPWQALFSQRPSFVPFAAAILLIFGLVFGSVGTVYAAQDSLPNDLLYSIKLTGEKLRLAFTPDTEDKISLLTSYADRRLQEATTLDSQGQPVPDKLATLMDGYLVELTSLTASLDESAAPVDPVAVTRTLRPQDRDQGRTNPMTGYTGDNEPKLDQLRSMALECHRIASPGDGNGDGDGDVELNQLQFQNQFKHAVQAQGDAPELPFTYQEEFKHQQGITSTLTSTITTTLTITPEVTVTQTITPGLYGPGPGPCELVDGLLPFVCSFGYDPGQFMGDRPVPDDEDGYGPGDSSGPLQPSETPKVGEPQQTPEPPKADDNSGKDNNKEGNEGSGGQKSKP